MAFTMLWRDIGVGLLIAGALSAWTPGSFWKMFFLASHPAAAMIWGAFVGPLIAVASFTCSVGNVPLAAVLWNGGISFGGVASFIFGDLIILPILNIYRKYYGGKMTAFMVVTFYFAMVAAALAVEGLFQVLGWVPQRRHTAILDAAITFNYTTVLDIIFGGVFIVLATIFFRSGGPEMMRMLEQREHHHDAHGHDSSDGHPDHTAQRAVGEYFTGYVSIHTNTSEIFLLDIVHSTLTSEVQHEKSSCVDAIGRLSRKRVERLHRCAGRRTPRLLLLSGPTVSC